MVRVPLSRVQEKLPKLPDSAALTENGATVNIPAINTTASRTEIIRVIFFIMYLLVLFDKII